MVGEVTVEHRSYFPNKGYSLKKTKFGTVRKLFPEVETQTIFCMVSHWGERMSFGHLILQSGGKRCS